MRVTFNEFAKNEFNDAAQFYEQEQIALGAAFIAEVERCVQALLEFPRSSPVVLGSVRRRLCSRFPYGLLYTVVESEIRILAVMNLKRRPGYWVGRS